MNSKLIYIDNGGRRDPRVNLAIEEHLLRNSRSGEDFFMLYINEPSVIIGRNQNPYEELNLHYIEEHNIHFVRRLSGGGTVYHDLGNLNFSYISDAAKENIGNFRNFTAPIIVALDRLGIKAELGKRNDILVGNYKVSGNAQYIAGKRMVSHGTLLYNTNLAQMEQALKVEHFSLNSKSIKSVRSPVTNISDFLDQPTSIEAFQRYLHKIMLMAQNELPPYLLNSYDWENVDKLVADRYQNWEWNYGRSPDFTVQKQWCSAEGDFRITFLVQRGIITEIQVAGENNPPQALSKLQALLVGVPYDERAISEMVKDEEVEFSIY